MRLKELIVSHTIEFQKPSHAKYKILIVDDDPHMLNVLHEMLKHKDYQTSTALNGEAALEVLETDDFDLVITDLNMGQVNGISVLKKAKELNPGTRVFITTANFDITYAIEALRLKADDYMLKPFNMSELLERVSLCLKKHSSPGRYYRAHIKLVE